MEPFSIVGAAGAIIGIVGKYVSILAVRRPRQPAVYFPCNAYDIYGTEFEDYLPHAYPKSNIKANMISLIKMWLLGRSTRSVSCTIDGKMQTSPSST